MQRVRANKSPGSQEGRVISYNFQKIICDYLSLRIITYLTSSQNFGIMVTVLNTAQTHIHTYRTRQMTDINLTATDIESDDDTDTVQALDSLETLGVDVQREHFITLVDTYNVSRLKADSQKFLASEDALNAFEKIAEEMSESDSAVADELWSLIKYPSQEVVTIGEAVDSSVYQSQFEVLPDAVNAIMCDRFFGLDKVGFFINPIELIRGIQGSLILSGGHHRLFVMCLLLRQLGNAEWEQIFDQEIPANIIEVNKDVLDKKDRMARVIELESIIWMASNGSRKPTPTEKDAFKFSKQGVNLADTDSIIDNPTLNDKQRFELLFLSYCKSQGIIADRNGNTMQQLLIDPHASDKEERFWQSPKPNTVVSLAGSFWSAITKIGISEDEIDAKGRKKKSPSKWTPSLTKYPQDYLELLFEKDAKTNTSLIEDALIATIAEDPDTRNISRSKAKHGQTLALLFDRDVEPRIKVKPQEAGVKKGSSKKSALGRRYS